MGISRSGVGASVIVCTSSTRPTGFAGMLIFETDTKRTYEHDGTSFRLLGAAIAVSKRLTTGSITLTAVTTWQDVNNAALDITLPAQVGDVISYTLNAAWNADAVFTVLDVATIVAAAPVNYFATAGGATDNPGQWQGLSGQFTGVSGTMYRTLVAGDISGGNVVLRLRARSGSAVVHLLNASATTPLLIDARNLGPAL